MRKLFKVITMIDCTKIKEIREDNDISQEKISEIIGVKRSTYSLWELGINIIPLEYLCEFANYFELSLDYVLGLTNKRQKVEKHDKFKLEILGENLKKLRVENKLYQKDIASYLNVSRSCVAEYESGKVCISLDNLHKISKKFKISIDDLCFKNNN